VNPASAANTVAPPLALSGIKLLLATIALGLGSFMNILDLTIVNVAVPTMAGDFAVSPTQATWIITSYSVAEAIMLPLAGYLAGRFGTVRSFVAATLLFTLASMLCAASVSFSMLLAARVMQGVFGASMIPLSQTLLTAIYPPHRRGMALGIWAMTTVIAPIVGPLAGGWLIDNASWHWLFLVNLPVGLLVGISVAMLLGNRDAHQPGARDQKMDWAGLSLLIIGIGSLQILLDKGNELDWFNSSTIIALAATAVFALLVFVVWELDAPWPLVDLRLFARRNFLVGAVCLMLGSMAFFGVVVIIPLWLQTFQGYTALWAGKTVAFGGVLAVILGPVIGANIGRVDARAITTFGFIAGGFLERAFYFGYRLLVCRAEPLVHGRRHQLFFSAAGHHQLVRFARRTYCGGLRPVQFHAQSGRQFRHRPYHLAVGQQCCSIPCETGGKHSSLQPAGNRLPGSIASTRHAG
jgi:DHA2 family multidrug resistance protein